MMRLLAGQSCELQHKYQIYYFNIIHEDVYFTEWGYGYRETPKSKYKCKAAYMK
jgi:hypothetical protein